MTQSLTTSAAQTKSEIVSSEAEALILVDASDQVVGYLDKSACHDGDGVLHRAFSLFIFNPNGELLLQQRAAGQATLARILVQQLLLASAPRRSHGAGRARRLEQELGLAAELEFTFKFEYSARFADLGTEHELCWVYVGQTGRRAGDQYHRDHGLALGGSGRLTAASWRQHRGATRPG